MTLTEALAFIRRRGSARCYELSAAGFKQPVRRLAFHVKHGDLIVCTVLRPGKPPATEYRLAQSAPPKPGTRRAADESVLLYLQRYDNGSGVTMKEMSSGLDINLGRMATILFHMHERGILRRKGDRKAYHYSATDEAAAIVAGRIVEHATHIGHWR